jgi:hypothetical protein
MCCPAMLFLAVGKGKQHQILLDNNFIFKIGKREIICYEFKNRAAFYFFLQVILNFFIFRIILTKNGYTHCFHSRQIQCR